MALSGRRWVYIGCFAVALYAVANGILDSLQPPVKFGVLAVVNLIVAGVQLMVFARELVRRRRDSSRRIPFWMLPLSAGFACGAGQLRILSETWGVKGAYHTAIPQVTLWTGLAELFLITAIVIGVRDLRGAAGSRPCSEAAG